MTEKKEETKKTEKKKSIIMKIVGVILVIFFACVVFILLPMFVPWGPQCKATRPVIKKVPPERNAWVEYNKAIAQEPVKKIQKNYNRLPEWIKEIPRDHAFTKEQKSYLDQFSEAFTHLQNGAKLPEAQYSTELYTGRLADLMATIQKGDWT
ncbi:MAG: hypothetical protein K8T10_04855 [Candidatus Eremiobacteraeota bacterium]|nr:hypothetical protein [Candidatus Eremiobacteraeota bacterium]